VAAAAEAKVVVEVLDLKQVLVVLEDIDRLLDKHLLLVLIPLL